MADTWGIEVYSKQTEECCPMIMIVFWLLLIVVSIVIVPTLVYLLFGNAVGTVCAYIAIIVLFLFRRRITRWFERRLRSLRRKAQQRQTTVLR